MVTVISTKSFSLEEQNIPVFGGCTDDTHGGIYSQKTVWSSSHILTTASHHRCCSHRNQSLFSLCVAALVWCGRAEALGPARPAFRVAALPAVWLGQIIGFPEACVSLFRNHKAVHQGVLVKICKSMGTVRDARCAAHTAGFLFSFLAKRTLRLSEWWCGCARGLVMIVSKPCDNLVVYHCDWLVWGHEIQFWPMMLGAAFWGPQERLSTLKGQSDKEKCSLWCSHFMWQQLTGQGRTEIYNQGWGRELWRGAGAPHCGAPWLPFAVSE